jgi:histone deacetylase 6
VEKDYIGWAIKNGFQVIDVNVPKVDPIADVRGYGSLATSKVLTQH